MHSTYLIDVELQFLPRTAQREQIGHQQSIQSVHNFVTVARWSKIVMLYKDAVDSTRHEIFKHFVHMNAMLSAHSPIFSSL